MRKQNRRKKTKSPPKMAVNVNLLCRLCLNDCDANSNNIFDSTGSSLTLRIMACAGLEVTQQDALPKQICLECRLALEKSFLFRNKCKNSDGKLRHHFRLINAGKESKLFEDFDDEFEDDYTESIELIKDLERKLHPETEVDVQNGESYRANPKDPVGINKLIKSNQRNSKNKEKSHSLARANQSPLGPLTRSVANQQQHNADVSDTKIDNQISFEVLIEVDKNENNDEVEYILADSDYNPNETDADSSKSDIFGANSSNPTFYELNDLTNADSNEIDDAKQDIEYLDENDEDPSGNNLLLESLLPAIKASVAQKSGTILDESTQYNIVRTSGEAIRVQCITSDDKEFEIEMVLDQTPEQLASYERDESGDFKIFSCSKCPKTFSRRGKLINHERDHTAKTSGQECPYCQKWFPSNSTLTRHIRVHTGEKPFQCSICKRKFIQKEILKRHHMTHSGERPFKCSKCSKSFILKEALRQHFNRNHTENPTPEMHKCPFCPKSFCHSSGLSRHLLIHAGRTFQCPYCHKKFNDKSALKRHTTSIHNITNNKLSSK